MSDLNIRFSNCFNFINNTKQYLEANPTDWRNVYTEEALAYAECDLMEMELEADYDAEEYDALLNGNAFRSSKRAQRRKANIRHHKADRRHGKSVPQSDKKYWDEQSGTWYRWDEKKNCFRTPDRVEDKPYLADEDNVYLYFDEEHKFKGIEYKHYCGEVITIRNFNAKNINIINLTLDATEKYIDEYEMIVNKIKQGLENA